MSIICIPTEVYHREFDAKLLLAVKLAAVFGHTVAIGYDKLFNAILSHKARICLMDKSASSIIHSGRIGPVSAAGGKIVISDEEGFNNLGIRGKKTFLSRISPQALHEIDLYACWGKKDYKFYSGVDNFLPKAKILGNCRSDLLGDTGKEYYKELSESLRGVYGKYVLVSDSFAVERLGLQGLPKFKITAEKQKLIEGEFNNWIETASKLRSYLTENIQFAAKSLPEVQFVIRPHPVGHPGWWHQQLGEFRNVHIVFRHSPEAWIHGAMAVATMGCTIGVQSMIAGKPTLELVSPNLPVYGTAPQILNDHVKSPVELVERIREVDMGGYSNYVNHSLLEEAWANTTRSTVEIFSKEIHQMCAINRMTEQTDLFDQAHRIKTDGIKWPHVVSMAAIKGMVRRAQRAQNIRYPIRITKIVDNLWVLQREG